MLIKTLGNNSKGNCHIITNSSGRSIILDLGVRCTTILRNIDSIKYIDFCLVTHEHKDHSLSVGDMLSRGIDVIDVNDTIDKVGKMIDCGEWAFTPISCTHSVPCVGYVIVNKADNDVLVYITDTNTLPKLKIKHENITLLVECNHDLQYILDYNFFGNSNYKDHLSIEQLCEWFKDNKENINYNNILLTHLSDSNIEPLKAKETISELTGTFVDFAYKGKTFDTKESEVI